MKLTLRGELEPENQSLDECHRGCLHFLKTLSHFLEATLKKTKVGSDAETELKAIIQSVKKECAPVLQINYCSPPAMDKYSLVTNVRYCEEE